LTEFFLLLEELEVQENTLKGLSRMYSTNCEKINEKEMEDKLYRVIFETIEVLGEHVYN
jgi:hypothetical protein